MFPLVSKNRVEIDSALLFQSPLQNSLDQWSSHLECLKATQGIFSRAASRASHFLSVGGHPRTGVPTLMPSSSRHTDMEESFQTLLVLTCSSSLSVPPWGRTGPVSSLSFCPDSGNRALMTWELAVPCL